MLQELLFPVILAERYGSGHFWLYFGIEAAIMAGSWWYQLYFEDGPITACILISLICTTMSMLKSIFTSSARPNPKLMAETIQVVASSSKITAFLLRPNSSYSPVISMELCASQNSMFTMFNLDVYIGEFLYFLFKWSGKLSPEIVILPYFHPSCHYTLFFYLRRRENYWRCIPPPLFLTMYRLHK